MTDIEELKVEIRILKERIAALEARPVYLPANTNVPWIFPRPWTVGDPPPVTYNQGPTCAGQRSSPNV